MNYRSALKLQQSEFADSAHANWKLQPTQALTVGSDRGGLLVVECGQVWATLDGPHQGPANDWGDRVLHRGDQLQLMPGQHVVLEVFGAAANEPAYLCWAPALDRSGSVVSMLGDWMLALGDTLQWLVPGRGRVLSPLEGSQP